MLNPIGQEQTEVPNATGTLAGILNKIQGVGKVEVYIHYSQENKQTVFLSTYLQSDQITSPIVGVLVVAEGAEQGQVKRQLIKTLSNVLQVAEHRIVIVPMNKEGKTN